MTNGLDGVIVAATSISSVGAEGNGLSYRGYSVEELANNCLLFEEIAYLLLKEKLPDLDELAEFMVAIASNRNLPDALKLILEIIPGNANSMDVLHIGIAALGTIEPELFPSGTALKDINVATRLLGVTPSILLYWHHYHTHGIRVETSSKVESVINATYPPLGGLSIVEHWFQLLFVNQPSNLKLSSPEVIRALNVSLILYADHEFNASTFASRVTAATLSDFHSSVTTAIGTLKGPLHGGASEAAMKLLTSFDSDDSIEQKLSQMLSKKELIMGFGHRIYKKGDPRSDVIKSWAKKIADLQPPENSKYFRIAERTERFMMDQKGLRPNLDFYTSVLYDLAGIPVKFFTPIFALSRISGWSAHIIEQRLNNRLIRPSGLYVGPPSRQFIPIELRGKDDHTVESDSRL